MQPIHRHSAEELATNALRQAILAGTLRPGARLTEVELATQMRVSRAPIRVALHQMVAEGLVRQIPYTGWVVASLTADDAWELYTLRACLESMAARLASSHLTDEGAELLKDSFETLCQCVNGGESARTVSDADFAFHKQIVTLADHRRLARQYHLVEQQVRVFIASTNALLQDIGSVVDQHQSILEAILKKSSEEAGNLSEQHNRVEGDKLVRHLRTLESACS